MRGAHSGTVTITFKATEKDPADPGDPADPPDTTAPANVSGLAGTAGNGRVTLNWTNPADADLASIEISWNGGTASVAKGTRTYTATGLSNGTAYTFILKAVDAAGNKSAGASVRATPVAPVSAPNLTALVAKPVKASAPIAASIDAAQYTGAVAWKKGDDSPFTGNFGASSVYKAVVTLTAKTGFTFNGVGANGFSYANATSVTNAANSGTVTITFPATAALGPVSGLSGTAGNGRVTLTWSDPAEADLASIEISWNGGTASAANGARTYTVRGLTNGTAYTFTLKAVDKAGIKSEGVTSGALTPLAPTGLVTVAFDGLPRDETINLSQTTDELSWKANTALTVSVGGGFTNHKWDLDGVRLGGTGDSLTLNAGELSAKRHKLTVFVTKNGLEYAKILDFTVRP